MSSTTGNGKSTNVFDHIVIGAGSAGAVVAARLSEDPDRSVLLLEAGPDYRSAATLAGIFDPNFWQAVSEPGHAWPALVAVCAAGQAPTPYMRGRGVGGSSAVNAMVGLHGEPSDYDRWARELGCEGWDAATFAALFEEIEDDRDHGDKPGHGHGGPIPLERLNPEQWAAFDRAAREAALALGYADAPDYHEAPGTTGFSPIALTTRDGRRVSCNDAYLEPARERPNLHIRGDAHVDRVLFDGTRAVGIRQADGTELDTADVVLCAGAIHSPAILLRSGIGGADGLPVGQNLIEHPRIALAFVLSEEARTARGARAVNTLIRYTSGLTDCGEADMQILVLANVGVDPETEGVGVLTAAIMSPFSRGQITLASDDPIEDPVVDFRMLTDDRDRQRLRDGFARMRDLAEHPAIAGISQMTLAGEQPLETVTDDNLDDWLDANVTDYVHAVGTCRWGRRRPGRRRRPVMRRPGLRRPPRHRRIRHARRPPSQHPPHHRRHRRTRHPRAARRSPTRYLPGTHGR